jgi:large subunit ribosomal protein L10
MPNIVKKMVVKELVDELGQAEAMLVVSFGGLTVAETEDLRGSLAEKGVQMRMVRNRLARIVLKERGVEFDDKAIAGNTAIAFGDPEGAIGAAKIFTEKAVKKAGKVKVRACLLEGAILGAAEANALANVPDKLTLRAMMLGVISGPARSLVGVLNGLPSGVARVLSARADELEKSEA